MSGLPFRYLLLAAAAAMTGTTAYTVVPGSPSAVTENVSPETMDAVNAYGAEVGVYEVDTSAATK